MKKKLLTALAVMALIQGYAQSNTTDSTYKPKKLQLEEINLVSSYYQQDGDNAAVTGGIGSEKLTDLANSIELKLVKYDRKLRKNNFGIEVGIDHYTSASSDKVDLKANSSASHADTRIYPTLSWSRENEKKGSTISAGLSSSTEYDYQSFGANIGFAQKTRDRMGEFSAKFQAYIDQVKLITPVELRPPGSDPENYPYGSSARNTYAGSLGYSQILNKKMQLMFLADIVQQNGYLGLPFHRVYFEDGSVHQERLPSQRFKVPLGIRFNYFVSEKFILRTYYRFYTDNWGLTAHTVNLEVPIKLSPYLSISPSYRFYQQSAVDYFKPYQKQTGADEYYTSNYDLSKFTSHFPGINIRFTPLKGVLGIRRISMVELRYGHYVRSTELTANSVSLNVRFK